LKYPYTHTQTTSILFFKIIYFDNMLQFTA
jgi:hypothetical protein